MERRASKRVPRRRARTRASAARPGTARKSSPRRHADLLYAFENADQEMCLCDARDRIVRVNRAFRERNSERRDFLAPGTRYEDYMRAGLRVGLPPVAVGREEQWLAERLRQRRAGGTSFELELAGGRWLLITDQRLANGGTLTAGIDITARKRAEQALVLSESRFRDFAAASSEWLWETDAEGRYTWFSEDVEIIAGFPREWHYGKSRIQLATESGADLAKEPWRSHLHTLAQRKPFRDFRYMRRGPDGMRWVRSSAVPHFSADGAFLGYRGTGVDITREVELEAQAIASRERLNRAIEDLNEPICLTDASGRIVVANRAFRGLNVAVLQHLVPGSDYAEHLRDALALGEFPDAAGREDAWLARRLAQRRLGGGPYEVRRKGGVALLVYDHRFDDGSVLTYAVDTTERVRSEEANRRFRAAMDASVDMILLIDRATMRYVDVNESVCRVLGYSREEILALGPQDLLPFSREELERQYDEFIADPSSISGMRSQYRCKDGTLLPFESTRRLLHLAEGPIIVAISRDIRAQLAGERAMQDLNQSLERRVAERTAALENALRELEAFSYSVSHDLRAPLRALDGHAHMLAEVESALSPEGRRHLAAIARNARHMGELVDALLGLARINRTELNRVAIDVEALLRPLVVELRQQYPGTEMVIGHFPVLDGDVVLVRQVLANLLDNACKFSAKREAPRVEVSWDENARTICVADNGVGFDMQYAAKLFGTFERLHTLGEFEGAGIGLAIVRRVVERHGGRVGAEAAPDRGARFFFSLAPD